MTGIRAAVLPDLLEAVQQMSEIDAVDWHFACRFAEKWKLSVADALLDLHFLEESVLAKALAKANNLQYLPGSELRCDFSEVDFETFDDLMSVGAAPLDDERLAICNPYDDIRGNLGNRLCQREMVVTERSYLFDALRRQGLAEWFQREDA